MQMIYDKMQGKGYSKPGSNGSVILKMHNSLRLCIVFTLLLFFATGCGTLGPNFRKPDVSVSENWLDI